MKAKNIIFGLSIAAFGANALGNTEKEVLRCYQRQGGTEEQMTIQKSRILVWRRTNDYNNHFHV